MSVDEAEAGSSPSSVIIDDVVPVESAYVIYRRERNKELRRRRREALIAAMAETSGTKYSMSINNKINLNRRADIS